MAEQRATAREQLDRSLATEEAPAHGGPSIAELSQQRVDSWVQDVRTGQAMGLLGIPDDLTGSAVSSGSTGPTSIPRSNRDLSDMDSIIQTFGSCLEAYEIPDIGSLDHFEDEESEEEPDVFGHGYGMA